MEALGTLGGSTAVGYYATAYIASLAKTSSLTGAASCLTGVSLVAPAAILGILVNDPAHDRSTKNLLSCNGRVSHCTKPTKLVKPQPHTER